VLFVGLDAQVHGFSACKKPDPIQSPGIWPRRRFSGVAWLAKKHLSTCIRLHSIMI
jgi:hypothetical protein